MEKINDTTWKEKAKDDPKDRLEVIIGDDKQPDFKPQIKIERWDNECNFSVRLVDEEPGEAQVKENGNKINWKKGNIEIDFFDIGDAYKFDYIIKQKPKDNKIRFTIQSKDVDFFYQPPLTQQEIDEGCFRPENVDGSYAVKSKTPKTNWVGGKEYKVGKIGSIYRPKLIDSNGWEVWGDLHIENGKYEVTIPEDFYNNAVYPIRSNDTFGYTENGETVSSVGLSTFGTKSTVATGANVTTISVYADPADTTDDWKAILYDSSKNLVVYTEIVDIGYTAIQWQVFNIADTNISAGDYILAVASDGGTFARIRYDVVSRESYDDPYTTIPYTSVPEDPWTPLNTRSRDYSIYATYTPTNENEWYISLK